MEQQNNLKILTKETYEEICDYIDVLLNDGKDLNRYNFIEQSLKKKFIYVDPRSLLSIADQRVQKYTIQRHRIAFNDSLLNKYKDLKKVSINPLLDLANNLKMPSMLVAKALMQEKMKSEKQNDCTNLLVETSGITYNNSTDELSTTTINTSFNETTEEKLSSQLQWLSNAILLKLKKNKEVKGDNSSLGDINLSLNSSTTSTLSCTLSNHYLTTNSYLIKDDPQLAYQVFICSVMDSFYGSCAEQLKSLNGKRYEQILRNKINKNGDSINSQYWTESECRARGLDMTPDIVLHEPLAVVQNEDNHFFVNWIESKAMFGCEGFRTRGAFHKQLFPYWNRYGPGVVIYWFGYVEEKSEENDFTKYCLLADDWPPKNSKILRYGSSIRKKI
ncbi:CDAN1-interacting nuclease 1 [Daktulosphaira vitifoliae]|uniref:CDAN1-interacting nuclease 1 n=1 Tax=Daktulosphaira vitifoliae TaxID=58002 RepID=UPI0021AAE8A7|nr:CDAN1-interacting nuclease 1 [Daktulosphaira vitifoliae]